MSATHQSNKSEQSNQNGGLVKTITLAKKLVVSSRYVLQLAEQGRIPCVRIGAKCIRYNLADVGKALGIILTDGGQSL